MEMDQLKTATAGVSEQDGNINEHHEHALIGKVTEEGSPDRSRSVDQDSSRTQSTDDQKDSSAEIMKQEEVQQLETTKQEMGEVREENQRLKLLLDQIVKDYRSLQMQFDEIMQQEQRTEAAVAAAKNEKPASVAATPDHSRRDHKTNTPMDIEEEEPELVRLSLGTSSTKTNIKNKVNDQAGTHAKINNVGVLEDQEGLTLGLDYCKFDPTSSINNESSAMNLSSDNSSDHHQETKEEEEEAGEPWPPSKILKGSMKTSSGSVEQQRQDDVSHQAHVKKARVSVRARCDAPTMHDGCQWRKYGQKIAKGNPCPRAYYRCTVAPSCPVRKQVQRCAEDMSILITTYEGSHNHPLPVSANAMASTTSAAACMLLSGPTSSSRPSINESPATISSSSSLSSSALLQGLNFNLTSSDHSFTRSRQQQQQQQNVFLQNPYMITSSPAYPTITLDLTAPPATVPPSLHSSGFAPSPLRYPSTNFSFSSSSDNSSSIAGAATSWSNNGSYLTYNNSSSNKMMSSSTGSSFRQQNQESYQEFLQKAIAGNLPAPPASSAATADSLMTDTIAKAITSDPSFQSALAAAITSFVGSEGESSSSINGCASSFLTRSNTSNSNSQEKSLMFLQPLLALSTNSKTSASASPVDNRENLN